MGLHTVPDAVDVLIVGAGPAGMAAALEAISQGLSVLIVDENPGPGGQVFRSVTRSPVLDRAVLGTDYHGGRALAEEFEASRAIKLFGTTVWMIESCDGESSFSVGVAKDGGAQIVTSRNVLVATGALERPFPIPGWTLPGVMTAGAAQTMLKASEIVPDGPTVLAGSGPLLYLLAAQYGRAGVAISALLDTTPRANWPRAFRHLPGFLVSPYFQKGLGLLRSVRRSTRVIKGVTALAARGNGALSEVAYTVAGREERIAARILLLHQGVVPQVNLAMAAGCRHCWNEERLAFEPVLDPFGESSIPGLFIAGDGGGVGGAQAAEFQGKLAGLGIAAKFGKLTALERDTRAAAIRLKLARALRGRRFLDRLFRPAEQFRIPADDVIVCRCEEVTAGAIRAVTVRGAQGPNQAKTFIRAGMGPCQGRLCGLTVIEIMAREIGVTVEATGHYRVRNPVKPITLGALAGLRGDQSPAEAAARRLF